MVDRCRRPKSDFADEIAAAASLLMGQADEGRPVVLVKGLKTSSATGRTSDLIRQKALDLFRAPPFRAVLRSRRSVRRYNETPVADDELRSLLEAATFAPSAHNRQPWRFAILKNSSVKERLAKSMGDRLREDRTRDQDPPELIERDVSISFRRITTAPVVIVMSLSMEDMDKYGDERRYSAERIMAVQGVAMATQNLLLACSDAGLGASIMCAPLFCPDIVVDVLGLPTSWEPQLLITVGHPAHAGKPFSRRPLSELARIIGE